MVKFSMLSNMGSRDNNEDNIGMYQDGEDYCFILADGLGGHGKGEVASQLAVNAVIEQFTQGERGEDFLDQAFENAQNSIVARQEEERACMDMKTTLVVLMVENAQIRWGHIGDSRLYYFQNGKLRVRTLDHSVPQMLVAVGEIKEKDIRHHPDRNRLLRVLGVEMDEMKHQTSEPIGREVRKDRISFCAGRVFGSFSKIKRWKRLSKKLPRRKNGCRKWKRLCKRTARIQIWIIILPSLYGRIIIKRNSLDGGQFTID